MIIIARLEYAKPEIISSYTYHVDMLKHAKKTGLNYQKTSMSLYKVQLTFLLSPFCTTAVQLPTSSVTFSLVRGCCICFARTYVNHIPSSGCKKNLNTLLQQVQTFNLLILHVFTCNPNQMGYGILD